MRSASTFCMNLEKLGVLLGDRRRLLRAIATLNNSASPPAAPAAPTIMSAVEPAPTAAAATDAAGD